MRIFPQKYDELDIGKYDKQLIAVLKSVFKRDDFTTLLLNSNPTKLEDGMVHILVNCKGILFINVKSEYSSRNDVLSNIFDRLEKTRQEEEIILKRLSLHRSLTKKGEVIFPIAIITYYPLVEHLEMDDKVLFSDLNKFINENCVFEDFHKNILQNENALLKFWNRNDNRYMHEEITEELFPDILNRIAPEYTIPKVRNEVKVSSLESITDGELLRSDRVSSAFILDENQINYVNRIKKGDQLIIACAGSGKSVILISKCLKIASLNPDKRFLITGFNKNLVSFFKWQIEAAGFSTRNVSCFTFHKLCRQLLRNNNLPVPGTVNGDFDKLEKSVIINLSNGNIKDGFYGIFIDEVQMFQPEWYKICYQLLENGDSNEHFFTICGDKSQSIKKSIKSGKAPWQGHGDLFPNFRGKSFPIEINYRNSIEINNFIKRFTDKALKYAEFLKVDVNKDSDIFLRGKSTRQGLDLRVLSVKQLNSDAEAVMILNQIIDIHEIYKIPYSSIAVIYHNKQYVYMKNWEDRDYKPIETLKNLMKQANIPYSPLVNSDDEYAVSYGDIDGVPLVSMESVLGLDFQAVILCGLRTIGEHDKTKGMEYISKYINSDDETISDEYNKNVNILYMACARAKDILRIVLTERKEDSIYSKMLIEAFEEKQVEL